MRFSVKKKIFSCCCEEEEEEEEERDLGSIGRCSVSIRSTSD